ncbi:MAG: TMEM43 family protein [Rhodospirillaceae bacterium]
MADKTDDVDMASNEVGDGADSFIDPGTDSIADGVADSDGSGTEVYARSAGSRIKDSLAGLIIGPLIFLASFVLLFWNEGNQIQTLQALAEGKKLTVSVPASPVERESEGRLVHVTGDLQSAVAVSDPTFGISVQGAIRLRRSVEMFQWSETKNDKTVEYSKKWSNTPINSSSFESQYGHTNPGMSVRGQTFNSSLVKLGDFRVDKAILDDIGFFEDLSLANQPVPKASYRRAGNYFFRGANPAQPQVGDIRVSFDVVNAQPVTVVAQQVNGVLAAYLSTNGTNLEMIRPGFLSIDAIYTDAHNDAVMLAWVLRLVGFILMLIGPMLFLKPISTFLSFIPWVGDFAAGIVGAGAFVMSLLIALPLTLITIAIAWLFFRPVIGISLLVAALVSGFGISRWRRAKVAGSAK